MLEYQEKVLNDEDVSNYHFKGEVRNMPKNFSDWWVDNQKRIMSSSSLPYWVRDNKKVIDRKKRVKTEEEKKIIREKWENRAKNKTTKTKEDIELEKLLGIERGEPMTFEQANELRGNVEYVAKVIEKDGKYVVNPEYNKSNRIYHINCQSCVVANEMRRRGWDVTAFGNTKGSVPERLSYQTELIWVDKNGKTPMSLTAGGGRYFEGVKINKTYKVMMSEFEDLTKEQGRYHIRWTWKNKKTGHIITAERLKDGVLRIYDPQNGKIIEDFNKYAKDFSLKTGIRVLRVDNLDINKLLIKDVVYKHSSSTVKNGIVSIDSNVTGSQNKELRKSKFDKRKTNSKIVELRNEALNSSGRFTIKDKVNLNNLATKELSLKKKSLKRTLSHCFNDEEIEALEYIWNNPDKLNYIRKSALGEGKDMLIKKNIDNVNKKIDRKIVSYHIYSFEYKNKIYYIKTEEHLNGFEQLYSFTKM